MDTSPWLTMLGALPLLGAILVSVLPGKSAHSAGVGIAFGTLGLAVATAVAFDPSRAGEQQLVERHEWIPQFGVSYALGVNGIGLSMIVLAAVLVPLCMLAMGRVVTGDDAVAHRRMRHFVALILVLEAMMFGVFAARDVFLFYVFFEAMLIPTYFLISGFGGPRAKPAAVKFLLYSLAGGLLMLVAVIGLYLQGPGGRDGFMIDKLTGVQFSSGAMEHWLFWGFFIAFAVKAPMWPLHTWLPDAAEQAPPGISTLLVGVLDKVGTFGMMTLCVVLFPNASKDNAAFIVGLGLLSMILGALAAIGEKDIYRLIAYTSISHFGFIVMGIFVMNQQGMTGSMLYMVNHGFSTAALFLVAGMFVQRRGSQKIADFGGYQRITPWLAGVFLIAGLSSLALPGMSSFVSEFLVILGTFQTYRWAAVIGAIGVVLSAMYILITYKRMMTGPAPKETTARDLTGLEMAVVAPIIAVILALGFYPKPVLDLINPAVTATMKTAGVQTSVADGGNR